MKFTSPPNPETENPEWGLKPEREAFSSWLNKHIRTIVEKLVNTTHEPREGGSP